VLLPVRDGSATIDAALESVQKQCDSDFEVVVVDDGSVDDTAARVGALAASDSRIRWVKQPRLGLVSALNHGLEEARAKLVARMDADDRMLAGRLKAQCRAMEQHPDWAVVATHVQLQPSTLGMQRHVDWLNSLALPQDITREIFIDSPLCHPSVMFRKQRVVESGGYRDVGWAEDHDLWFRLMGAGHAMGVVPQVLHQWNDSPTRLTRTHPRYSADAMMRMKAHYLRKTFGSRLRIWGAGRDGKRMARALEAEGVAIISFVDIDPGKIGGVRRGSVPVIGPDQLNPPQPTDPMMVVMVGVPGARDEIRRLLHELQYVETRHFICAA
jgi:glycosyltransferase involved in cell wall biosynthesis